MGLKSKISPSWLKSECIKQCFCVSPPIQAWESDEAIEEDMPESPGAEKQDKEKDHRDSKKNRGETAEVPTTYCKCVNC